MWPTVLKIAIGYVQSVFESSYTTPSTFYRHVRYYTLCVIIVCCAERETHYLYEHANHIWLQRTGSEETVYKTVVLRTYHRCCYRGSNFNVLRNRQMPFITWKLHDERWKKRVFLSCAVNTTRARGLITQRNATFIRTTIVLFRYTLLHIIIIIIIWLRLISILKILFYCFVRLNIS